TPAKSKTFLAPSNTFTQSPCVTTLYVRVSASKTASADDVSVEVEPNVRVQQSRTPASRSTCFGISPATRPRPRGPGNTSTRTLPVLPVTLNGTVCIVPQRHSQL